jgi:hypothetical protein
MNTSIISHRMFVAALSNSAGVADKSARSAYGGATNGLRQPVTRQSPLEQLATMASRYWSDFPFVAGIERRTE